MTKQEMLEITNDIIDDLENFTRETNLSLIQELEKRRIELLARLTAISDDFYRDTLDLFRRFCHPREVIEIKIESSASEKDSVVYSPAGFILYSSDTLSPSVRQMSVRVGFPLTKNRSQAFPFHESFLGKPLTKETCKMISRTFPRYEQFCSAVEKTLPELYERIVELAKEKHKQKMIEEALASDGPFKIGSI